MWQDRLAALIGFRYIRRSLAPNERALSSNARAFLLIGPGADSVAQASAQADRDSVGDGAGRDPRNAPSSPGRVAAGLRVGFGRFRLPQDLARLPSASAAQPS